MKKTPHFVRGLCCPIRISSALRVNERVISNFFRSGLYALCANDPVALCITQEPAPGFARLVLFSSSTRSSKLGSCRRKTKPISKADGFLVARSGFEPEHTEPESVVLPLYYQAISSPPLNR